MVAFVAVGLLAAAPASYDVIRAKGLIIVDDQGRERILMGAPAPPVPGRAKAPTESIVFRSETGADRVILGEQPGPQLAGKLYPRVATGWGMSIATRDGDERGGMTYLDDRGAAISIDRPTGDAVGMMVDEKSGFAGLVVNYDNNGVLHSYPTALRVGTNAAHAFAEVTNRDGTPAGALVAGSGGHARLAEGAAQ